MKDDNKRTPDIYLKILIDFLFAILICLVLIFVVPKALGFFLPFVIGWIIAVIANPLVRFLEKRLKIIRKHSSVIIIIAALAIVVGILYFSGVFLARQIIGVFKDLPEMYVGLQQQMNALAANLNGVYAVMPENVQDFLNNAGSNIMTYLGNAVSNMKGPSVTDAGSLVKNVAEVFLMAIITLMSAYFFIADREKLGKMLKTITPDSIQKQYTLIKDNFAMAIGGYFKAQFKIMLVIIVILFIGFEILGINYSFLLALGIALLDFLPVFGTGTVIGPWAIINLINGHYMEAVCLTVIYLICQVVRQILQPKMVGDSIGLNPLATLVFMFIGYRVKGILGMIIGIPIGMALLNMYRAGIFDKLIHGVKIVIRDINEYRKY